MDWGNVFSGLKVLAQNKPDEVCVVYDDQKLTRKALYENANAAGNALIARGVKKGDHIAVYMKNRIEMIEIYFAIATIGAVSVPINYMIEGDTLAHMINFSDVKMILLEVEKLSAYEQIQSQLNGITAEQTIVVGHAEDHSMYMNYSELLKNSSIESPGIHVESTDPHSILFSSGTTSLPKGVLVTHGNMINRSLFGTSETGINQKDNILLTVPIYHAVGHLTTFYLSLIGSKLVLTRDFNPQKTLQIIQDEAITFSFFVPTQYIMLLNVPNFEQYDLRSLKAVQCAGAPLPSALKSVILDKFGCDISEFYGSTEAASVTYLHTEDFIRKAASVGQQASFAHMMIVDDDGNEVEVGQEGEIAIKGPMLFHSYYKQPEEMSKSFFADGWFRTGDMAKMDEERFYYLLDRKKDMLISGGVNVYPKDIEEVLYKHEAILEVAVVGVVDEKWGEKIKAYVVLKPEYLVDKEEIIAFCNPQLAAYQHIREIEFLDALPRNPSGKILKRELRKREVEKC